MRSIFDSAEGVGAQLARDLPRSGSKTIRLGRVRQTACIGFAAASRQIVGKPTPTPSAESKADRAKSNRCL